MIACLVVVICAYIVKLCYYASIMLYKYCIVCDIFYDLLITMCFVCDDFPFLLILVYSVIYSWFYCEITF